MSQHLQQDRQVDGTHVLPNTGAQYRTTQVPMHMPNIQEDYSFEIEANQVHESGAPSQRLIQTFKMRQARNQTTQQTQKEYVMNSMKEMKKQLHFINSTDWMFLGNQTPQDSSSYSLKN